jgi:hypothetical protein
VTERADNAAAARPRRPSTRRGAEPFHPTEQPATTTPVTAAEPKLPPFYGDGAPTLTDRPRRESAATPFNAADVPVTTAPVAVAGPKLPPYTGD